MLKRMLYFYCRTLIVSYPLTLILLGIIFWKLNLLMYYLGFFGFMGILVLLFGLIYTIKGRIKQ